MKQLTPKIDYRRIFDHLFDGLTYCQMIFDSEEQPLDFVYLEVSKNFLAFTGLAEVIGRKATELMPGLSETNPEFLEMFGRAALTGQPQKFETYLPALTKWFLINAYSQKKGDFVAVWQDITAQKQAAQKLVDEKIAAHNVYADLNTEKSKLDEAKAKVEAIIRSVADGLMAMDKEGRIVLINRSFEQILGWQAAEVYGKLLPQVVPMIDKNGETVPASERLVFKIFEGLVTTTITTTAYYQRKDGTSFPVALSVSPIMIGQELIGAVEVFRDITKEKEIDHAKTEFVSLASHQLKTPPTAIKLLTERILSGRLGPLTPRQKEYIHDIRVSNQRMIDIINGLLNVSRIELGSFVLELSEQNIYEVIQSIIHDLRPALDKKQMRLEHLYQSSNPCLLIDESLFRMVTTNLLTNAINYTATGGLVKIEERLANQGQSLAGKFLAEDYLVVIISDTGCGIPPNQQGKLFTKFFRADNAIEKHPDGTGLGLYIVKSLLDNTGGLIWFTSQENQGSTFYVAIPLSGMRSRVDENK